MQRWFYFTVANFEPRQKYKFVIGLSTKYDWSFVNGKLPWVSFMGSQGDLAQECVTDIKYWTM